MQWRGIFNMSIALDEFNSCELLRISFEIYEWLEHKLHPLHIFSLLMRLYCSNCENRPHKSLEGKFQHLNLFTNISKQMMKFDFIVVFVFSKSMNGSDLDYIAHMSKNIEKGVRALFRQNQCSSTFLQPIYTQVWFSLSHIN